MGLLKEGTVVETQESVAEVSHEIVQEDGTEMPGFDTGVDLSEQPEAANEVVAVPAAGAPATESNVVAIRPATGGGMVTGVAAVGLTSKSSREVVFAEDDDDELEGLAIDSFSFPNITQKDGMFKIGDEILGQKFNFIIQRTRDKYLYKEKTADENEKEAKLAYSYDKPGPEAMDSNGRLISEIKAEWIQGGVAPENIIMGRYLDIESVLVGGEFDGSFATIQVPPTSIPIVSGKILELKAKKVKSIKDAVLEMSAPKAVGSGQRKFYPFLMKFVRMVSEA